MPRYRLISLRQALPLRDETGDLLTPTHTQGQGRRLRYYVSNRLISGGPDPSGWRLPAAALEDALLTLLARHLEESAARHSALSDANQSQKALPCSASGRAELLGFMLVAYAAYMVFLFTSGIAT